MPDLYPAIRVELKDGRTITIGPSIAWALARIVGWLVFTALVVSDRIPLLPVVIEAMRLPWR
jgi:hypothetical protein